MIGYMIFIVSLSLGDDKHLLYSLSFVLICICLYNKINKKFNFHVHFEELSGECA